MTDTACAYTWAPLPPSGNMAHVCAGASLNRFGTFHTAFLALFPGEHLALRPPMVGGIVAARGLGSFLSAGHRWIPQGSHRGAEDDHGVTAPLRCVRFAIPLATSPRLLVSICSLAGLWRVLKPRGRISIMEPINRSSACADSTHPSYADTLATRSRTCRASNPQNSSRLSGK